MDYTIMKRFVMNVVDNGKSNPKILPHYTNCTFFQISIKSSFWFMYWWINNVTAATLLQLFYVVNDHLHIFLIKIQYTSISKFSIKTNAGKSVYITSVYWLE